jgi:hypothetical protein
MDAIVGMVRTSNEAQNGPKHIHEAGAEVGPLIDIRELMMLKEPIQRR